MHRGLLEFFFSDHIFSAILQFVDYCFPFCFNDEQLLKKTDNALFLKLLQQDVHLCIIAQYQTLSLMVNGLPLSS